MAHKFWPITVFGGHYFLRLGWNQKVRPKTATCRPKQSESRFEAWAGVRGEMTEVSVKTLHITHNGTVSQTRTVNTKFLCVYELKEKDLAFGRSNIIGRTIARPCIFNSYTYKILVSDSVSSLNSLNFGQFNPTKANRCDRCEQTFAKKE